MGVRDRFMVIVGGNKFILLLGQWVMVDFTVAPTAVTTSSPPLLDFSLRRVLWVGFWVGLVVGGG